MDTKIITGFVEEDEACLPFELTITGDKFEDFVVYFGLEMGDHISTFNELVNFYNNTYFASRQDFISNSPRKFTDLFGK